MSTALHLNTIHDIISSVERSHSSHGIFTSNSTMRKRARYLVSEAHALLSMLRFRGEMSRDAKAEYEYVYSRYQGAMQNTNAREPLEAAQDLWSFALTQARNTSHDLITQANPSSRVHSTRDLHRAPPPAPARDRSTQQHNSSPVVPPRLPPRVNFDLNPPHDRDTHQRSTREKYYVPPRLDFNLEPPHDRDTRGRYYVPPRIRFPQPAPLAQSQSRPQPQHCAPPPEPMSAAWPPPPPPFSYMPMPMAMPVLSMMPAGPPAIPSAWAAPPPMRR
ncbi:hypothetical protein C8Q72DRAFT_386637 [Fomitopsis betulina]|nr:hypothetical protein C8Q72DRAFT_386637 [Fomitopsis betulina]